MNKFFKEMFWWMGLLLMFAALIPAAMFIIPLIPGSTVSIEGDQNGMWITACIFGAISYVLFSLSGSKLNLKNVVIGILAIFIGVLSQAIESYFHSTIGDILSSLIKSLVLVLGIFYLTKSSFLTKNK